MLKLLKLNLTAFDSGAAGGEGATGGNGNSVQAIGQPEGATGTKTGGDFSNVVFGKQNDGEPAGTETVKNTEKIEITPKERKVAFEELIKGEYKEEFSRKFQEEFNKRHKGYKETVEKFNKADRLLGLVAQRYGETDIDKLEKRILSDNSYLEEEAAQRGMDIEQLAEIKRLQNEAETERKRRERLENEMLADEQYRTWIEQAKNLKENYPDFDLNTEIHNSQFMDLLQRGISVDHAYKILHFDDIIKGSVTDAMQKSAKATADSIAARGTRPKENGNTGSAVVYKSDVSKLTKADRAEIARRVARGESISF